MRLLPELPSDVWFMIVAALPGRAANRVAAVSREFAQAAHAHPAPCLPPPALPAAIWADILCGQLSGKDARRLLRVNKTFFVAVASHADLFGMSLPRVSLPPEHAWFWEARPSQLDAPLDAADRVWEQAVLIFCLAITGVSSGDPIVLE